MHRQRQQDFDGAARVQATAAGAPDNEAMSSALSAFPSRRARWFTRAFPGPTEHRRRPGRRSRRAQHLVAAPTGSGKTLTAFLAAIDALVREGSRTACPTRPRSSTSRR
jgi:Lhr-like helicase